MWKWDDDKYDMIKKYCKKFLFKSSHNVRKTHLEDMIQWCAMEYFRREGNVNLKHACIDYCRNHSLSKGKRTSNESKVMSASITMKKYHEPRIEKYEKLSRDDVIPLVIKELNKQELRKDSEAKYSRIRIIKKHLKDYREGKFNES